jgi:hypothetical protein
MVMMAARSTSNSHSTADGSDEIRSALSGQAVRHAEIDPPAKICGERREIADEGTTAPSAATARIESTRWEAQDDREGGEVDDSLPMHSEREEGGIAGRLSDVRHVEKPQRDQHQAEATLRSAASPVEPDGDRAEDEVHFLDRQPAGEGEEVRLERDGERHGRRRDARDDHDMLPRRAVSPTQPSERSPPRFVAAVNEDRRDLIARSLHPLPLGAALQSLIQSAPA